MKMTRCCILAVHSDFCHTYDLWSAIDSDISSLYKPIVSTVLILKAEFSGLN